MDFHYRSKKGSSFDTSIYCIVLYCTVLYCTSFLGPYRVLKASPNTQELTFHRTDHQLISIYL